MSAVSPFLIRLAAAACIAAAPFFASAAELPYAESFDGPNGASWPSPWFAGSTHVTVADLQQNRARLNGDAAFVARMILPGFAEADVEAEVTVEFENAVNQGFGFYVRQNGGTLQEYTPHGQGYAMFLKGGWAWPEDLGLWREIDGVETQFAWGNNPVPGGVLNGTRYRLRYRVTQSSPATTLLQAKVWPEAAAEPAAWTIEATDTRAELQGTLGSFAIDIYNNFGTGHIFIDDLVINRYPLATSVDFAPGEAGIAGIALSLPRPHPVIGDAEIDVSLAERGDARVLVFDASGRLVARPFAGALGAGVSRLSWEPRAHDASPLAAGVYFLRLEAGGHEVTRRVVIVR